MKSRQAFPWLSLLVLAGCGEPPEPPTPEPARFDQMAITCTPSPVVAGQSAQCTASALDQYGQPFSISAFTWTSGDESIARVDTSGRVSTVLVSSGDVAIRAQASSGDATLRGETSLAVSPKPPTEHTGSLTSASTWKAAENPHLVTGVLTVDASALLTLEAGAVIRFAPDAELRVTRGSLVASGTAQAPILLQAPKGSARGAWKGVVFAAKDAVSSLEYVTLEGCGGAQGEGACLTLRDGAAPVLKDVTVRDSASGGVLVADEASAFGAGSTRLSVSGSAGVAVKMAANQASTLPIGGALSGNTPNVVELTGTSVSRTQTWSNPSIPYLVNGTLSLGNTSTPAVLTLSAGTVVRFGSGARLVARSSGAFQGGLVLDGTAEAPILLTAHSDNPQPGHWRGVHVMTASSSAGRISHAIIEYAGMPRLPDERYFSGNGNLNLLGDATGNSFFTVTDLIVQKSSGPGFYLSNEGKFGEGSARLTSRDNVTYPIALQPNGVGVLPKDVSFQGNGINSVALLSGTVSTTQTWPKLNLPYLLVGTVGVGYLNNPTLTIAPGTEIQAAEGSALMVAYYSYWPGALVAKGTVDAPIRFIPDKESAPNGYWAGIDFWVATGSQLDYVLVSHGGGANSTDYPAATGTGNLNAHKDIGKFVTNSTFKHGKRCAITVGSEVKSFLNDPELHNTFIDNTRNSMCFE